MAQIFISDPETRRNVAVIRNGEIFRDDEERAKIAIIIGMNMYDLLGNSLGRLDDNARILPAAFKKLLEGGPPIRRPNP